MFILHYLIPVIIFYFLRSEVMIAGLLMGNLVDLDHLYYRLIGKVEWFSSACGTIGSQCSWGVYPLHNIYVFVISLLLGIFLIFSKNKYSRLFGWISIGIFLNLSLDYLALIIGFNV